MTSYMKNLNQLSQKQIEKIVKDSQAELDRRKVIDSVTAEIQLIIKKYKIDINDIDMKQFASTTTTRRPKKKTKVTKPNDRRRTVNAKYGNPNGTERWTGRGRPPAWVLNICQTEKIDIEAFKKNDRFKF